MPCNETGASCLAESPPRFQSTQQFSITALTDSSRTIKERYAYEAKIKSYLQILPSHYLHVPENAA